MIDEFRIESSSRKNGIAEFSFADCKMKSIGLSRQVHIIDRFALFESSIEHIGSPTSGVAHRAMRETAPHARGVSKARQL
jgi:hypothetical protein